MQGPLVKEKGPILSEKFGVAYHSKLLEMERNKPILELEGEKLGRSLGILGSKTEKSHLERDSKK